MDEQLAVEVDVKNVTEQYTHSSTHTAAGQALVFDLDNWCLENWEVGST